jgi:uncharacterized protein with beta-barrel porin domain
MVGDTIMADITVAATITIMDTVTETDTTTMEATGTITDAAIVLKWVDTVTTEPENNIKTGIGTAADITQQHIGLLTDHREESITTATIPTPQEERTTIAAQGPGQAHTIEAVTAQETQHIAAVTGEEHVNPLLCAMPSPPLQ